jgi:hypothetical protein
MPDDSRSEPPARFDLRVSEEIEGGVYANFLNVWHTAHEFTLDFASTLPAEASVDEMGGQFVRVPARVSARVRLPPTLIFDVLRALNEDMTRYEQVFGPINRPSEGGPIAPPEVL